MEKTRETLKIVVVGHVDHGKSTLIGRLLYDTNSLPEGTVERVKRISKEKGKTFEYAYLLDAFEEEQRQGITIDITQLQFHTEKRDYVIIDAPGHKEFLKNMISGAASAEAALLLVDANEGVKEQSRRHGYILSLLGIQKVYVIVNKMDLVDYSMTRFNQIRNEMNEFLNNLGVYPLKYIPTSAFLGENIARSSKKMPWYDEEPILKAIDLFEKDKEISDKPLRFPIQDVYKFDDRRIIVGRIESGQLKIGDEILISPSNKTTRVKGIEYWSEKDKTDKVSAGMSVGITVEDEFFNNRGELISHKKDTPLTGMFFRANLFWLGKKDLVKNKKYKLKLTTQEVECEILSINKVIDASTLETFEDASAVKINDVAEVTIKTKEMISFDEYKNNQNTGRFVIVDRFDVSGGGIIVAADNKELSNVIQLEDYLKNFTKCFNMDISWKGKYGLRVIADVAANGTEKPVTKKDISQRQNIPDVHLEEILFRFVNAGLIKYIDGPQKGYILGKDSENIIIADIMQVFDENLSIINENSIESNIRGKVEDCLLVNVWKKINESINTMLDSITLKDLVQEYNNSNDRQLIC
ncbi:MAG: hypothetical protein PWQ37_701 [Candidatus Petromonas sp.]|jgi:bifunctional enzyme CysN/CysC/sulfate adenylyltransferase subunit 1|nr:hypothetical protein [Candidatus Petromonas sp.]